MDYIKVPVDLARRVLEDFESCQGMMEPYYSQNIEEDDFPSIVEFSELVPKLPLELEPVDPSLLNKQDLFSDVLSGNRCMLCSNGRERTKGFNARHSAEQHALQSHPDKIRKAKP